ncbi:unnamed protein product, partial [Ectocarpus sp. 4 AP-2014]
MAQLWQRLGRIRGGLGCASVKGSQSRHRTHCRPQAGTKPRTKIAADVQRSGSNSTLFAEMMLMSLLSETEQRRKRIVLCPQAPSNSPNKNAHCHRTARTVKKPGCKSIDIRPFTERATATSLRCYSTYIPTSYRTTQMH